MEFDYEKIMKKSTVINCATKEEAKQLLDFMKSKEHFHHGICYEHVYSAETCYDFRDKSLTHYSDIEYQKKRNYTILKFEDVLLSKYPYYGVYDCKFYSVVVKFTQEETGKVIFCTGEQYKAGRSSISWFESAFKRLTKEELKQYNLTEEGETKVEAKYELIKDLSGKIIIEHSAYKCDQGLDDFLKKFGYHSFVKWTKENEDYVSQCISGGIEWLLNNNFIKEKKEKFIYDPNKIYCTQGVVSGKFFKLSRISSSGYNFICIDSDCDFWGYEIGKTHQESIDMAIKKGYKIITFDSTKEMAEYIIREDIK